ncbi:MAG: hypothetical protein QHH74_09460 [Spirochaetota bacterium]|nr:hypothetical protein [Spirochaetota bacterium]
MKNTIALFVCALAIATAVSCGDQSSGSSSSAFKIQPGDVSTITPNLTGKPTSFDITFDMSHNYKVDTEAYAIIISNVNNTGNVGIAFGTNPKSNRSFKAFIYYNGDISDGIKSGTATVIENGARYSGAFTDINFSFTGPDMNNCYTITIGNITIESKTLTITSLKAYLVQ